VLVVGGGEVARAKVLSLLEAGAAVTVVAPDVVPGLRDGRVELLLEHFRPEHLDGAWFVVAAATAEVNRTVRRATDERCMFVNVVDDLAEATAYLGAVVRRGDVVAAISTNGKSPALASLLREALEYLLPQDVGSWADIGQRARRVWRHDGTPWHARKPLLLRALQAIYDEQAKAEPTMARGS
jgi:siroheme synthase-like protein